MRHSGRVGILNFRAANVRTNHMVCLRKFAVKFGLLTYRAAKIDNIKKANPRFAFFISEFFDYDHAFILYRII